MEIRSGILTAEAVVQLQEGINLLLSRWTALQMVVENEWGGPHTRQKSQQLAVDIFSWLTSSKEPIYIDDLENLLDDFMESMNTEIEDGSIEVIAEKIMIMHEECMEGNYNSVARLRETNPPTNAVAQSRQAVNDEDDSDEDDDESSRNNDSSGMMVDFRGSEPNDNEKNMMIDEPKELDEAVEDGWTTVGPRRNRGRRN